MPYINKYKSRFLCLVKASFGSSDVDIAHDASSSSVVDEELLIAALHTELMMTEICKIVPLRHSGETPFVCQARSGANVTISSSESFSKKLYSYSNNFSFISSVVTT